ncbi:MAG TPA: homoserine O-succinyltransferase [Clostridiales bacterium]|nr:homoserine O-succinyltransferase [Clostridiales bacterium]
MPIKIPHSLPAAETLIKENIFIMDEKRAMTQDIRPLQIVILNLMPTKITTETQFLRLLSNTPLQIDVCLLATASHQSKNTPTEHLTSFYQTFDDIKNEKFDGLIITGAPVETLPFEEVDYWDELIKIIEWSKHNVYSTMYVCWGAYAGLYYNHKIPKYPLDNKIFGIFDHNTLIPSNPLVRGFNEVFSAPHSRYTYVKGEDIAKHDDLLLVADSDTAGVFLVATKDGREVYITGHTEYDFDTLQKEYQRDVDKGLSIKPPYNYFKDNDPNNTPKNTWRAHAHLLFSNWLNYFVYQNTPYNLEDIL